LYNTHTWHWGKEPLRIIGAGFIGQMPFNVGMSAVWVLKAVGLSLSLGIETLSLGVDLGLGHQCQSVTSINCIHITLEPCGYRSLLLNFDAGLLFRK